MGTGTKKILRERERGNGNKEKNFGNENAGTGNKEKNFGNGNKKNRFRRTLTTTEIVPTDIPKIH